MSLSLVEDQISDPHIYAHSSTLRISTKNETPLPFPLSFPACVHYICSGRGRKYFRQRKVSVHYKYLFPWLEDSTNSQVIFFFAQRQPQVPPRPIVLVQRRPDLLQTAQRRGACLHSLVFYQTVFCSFAVNKDQNNLHNRHPFSCRELAAALTRTPPAAKIKLTAVHMVGQRFSPFETLH